MADNLQATPRNELLGLLSDAMYGGINYMKDPRRSQQMQGLAGLLESTGIPQTTQRMAYGEPLTNIGRANVPLLKPETADAMMNVAPFAPAVGRLASRAIRATEGMPVGMGIKPINLNKGIYKPELTMEEMLKVKDIPTVDRVKQSIDLVGEKEFEKMVNAQYKKYKPSDQDQEAMLVESVTLDILGKAQRSPYPQQSALDLAQQRAALPVEQGGLGLLANNTAMDRAKAMGFETSALHGSGTPDINAFDPNLVGTKAGNAFDNYMWFTSSPESASGYALNTNQFALIPDVKALNNQINQIGKDISSAYTNKNMDKVGDLRKELSVLMKQKSDIYKDFEMGKYISEGSTTYPVLLKSNEFMPYEANNQNWMKANRPAIEESQSRGFQGVEIKNVKDNPNPSIGSVISNTYATENPDLIRSRFAAFDPFRKDVATATAMGVAAPDLLAAEPTPEELQRRQSASLLFP
jgi:hypothetical protein